MRKTVIFLSFVCFIVLGVGICWPLLDPAKKSFSEWLSLIGLLILLVDGLLVIIYMFRQNRNSTLQLEQRGITITTQWSLLTTKSKETRLYTREFRLQVVLIGVAFLVAIANTILGLVLPQTAFSQVANIISPLYSLSFPTFIFIYAILSKELTKHSEAPE